jgi:hypothetical protein
MIKICKKCSCHYQGEDNQQTSGSTCFAGGPHEPSALSPLDGCEATVSVPLPSAHSALSTCRKCGIVCIPANSNDGNSCPASSSGHEFLAQGVNFHVPKAAIGETDDRTCTKCGCLHTVGVGDQHCVNGPLATIEIGGTHEAGQSYVLPEAFYVCRRCYSVYESHRNTGKDSCAAGGKHEPATLPECNQLAPCRLTIDRPQTLDDSDKTVVGLCSKCGVLFVEQPESKNEDRSDYCSVPSETQTEKRRHKAYLEGPNSGKYKILKLAQAEAEDGDDPIRGKFLPNFKLCSLCGCLYYAGEIPGDNAKRMCPFNHLVVEENVELKERLLASNMRRDMNDAQPDEHLERPGETAYQIENFKKSG